jgi:hypothetical protein
VWFDAGLCNTPGFQLFCVLYVFCIYFCIIQKIHRGRTDQGEKFHREVYTEPSWHAGVRGGGRGAGGCFGSDCASPAHGCAVTKSDVRVASHIRSSRFVVVS